MDILSINALEEDPVIPVNAVLNVIFPPLPVPVPAPPAIVSDPPAIFAPAADGPRMVFPASVAVPSPEPTTTLPEAVMRIRSALVVLKVIGAASTARS